VIFELRVNSYGGDASIELQVVDMAPAQP